MTYGPWGTLLWTGLASAAYCSYLIPALEEYELTASGASELAIRNLFFFLAALVVNRVVTEHRRQVLRYQTLAETLAETNQRLEQAQAEARRSERLAALGQLSAGLAHEIRNRPYAAFFSGDPSLKPTNARVEQIVLGLVEYAQMRAPGHLGKWRQSRLAHEP